MAPENFSFQVLGLLSKQPKIDTVVSELCRHNGFIYPILKFLMGQHNENKQ